MKIAIVILNWNGIKLLEEFLPSVVNFSEDNPIYIIDNNSNDLSVNFIKKNHPNINVILNTENYGYAKGYNEGLKQVDEDIYCLLNNDVEVTEGWLRPIVKQFESDKYLTIAQPKILDYKNKNKFEYAGAAGGFIDYYGYPYCRGRIFDSIEIDNGQYDQNIEIFWASGACFFIRKEVFDKLNGFDEYFYNHMEEIDLCWRLTNLNNDFKKKFIYESIVFHLGGGSFNYNNPKKLFYNVRNHKWMMIKNTDVFTNFNITFSNENVFYILNRLKVILIINMIFALYHLLLFKFQHFNEIIKAMNYRHLYKDGYKFPMEQNYLLLRPNNKKPKYYVIKSIIYNYLILKKRKFSELNK
tara:strand:+ start:459 stop:1523 length:1065 start_codon:yes stop_codon:yes gene_type:complete